MKKLIKNIFSQKSVSASNPQTPDKFTDGNIIKLIKDSDFDEIPKGTYGSIWGVYNMNPTQYEATFYAADGEEYYYIFNAEDADLASINDVEDENLKKWHHDFFGDNQK